MIEFFNSAGSDISAGLPLHVLLYIKKHVVPGSVLDCVDFLPSPLKLDSWSSDLPTDGVIESNPVFIFDGKSTSAEVPFGDLLPNIGSQFTISTWMKHDGNNLGNDQSGEKEHILCSSDGEGSLFYLLLV